MYCVYVTYLNRINFIYSIPIYSFNIKSHNFIRGGGVYIHNGYKFKDRIDLTIFADNMFESVYVEIENTNLVRTVIGVTYTPEHFNLNVFDEYIKSILCKLSMNKHVFYILEDFMINFLDNTDTSTNFLSLMVSSYFTPCIHIPTRLNYEGNFTSLLIIFLVIQITKPSLALLRMIFWIIHLSFLPTIVIMILVIIIVVMMLNRQSI